jgi:hypothetical protein
MGNRESAHMQTQELRRRRPERGEIEYTENEQDGTQQDRSVARIEDSFVEPGD